MVAKVAAVLEMSDTQIEAGAIEVEREIIIEIVIDIGKSQSESSFLYVHSLASAL